MASPVGAILVIALGSGEYKIRPYKSPINQAVLISQEPVKLGFLFSTKAPIPSFWSWEAKSEANRTAS